MKKLIVILLLTGGTIYFFSCKKDQSNTNVGTTPFYVHLTDAPNLLYDSVIIDLKSVEVINDNGTNVMLNAVPGQYNLLDYTNGKDTLIASAELPSVTVSQIRLILGPGNY